MAACGVACLSLVVLIAAATPGWPAIRFSVDVSERATAIYHVACLGDSLPCSKPIFEEFWQQRLSWSATDQRQLEMWKAILTRIGKTAPQAGPFPYVGNTAALQPALAAQRRVIAALFDASRANDLRQRTGLSAEDADRVFSAVEHFRRRLNPWWQSRGRRAVPVDLRRVRAHLRGGDLSRLISDLERFSESDSLVTEVRVHAIPVPVPSADAGNATFAGNHVVVEAIQALDAEDFSAVVLHESTHSIYDRSPTSRLTALMDQFAKINTPQASGFYALLNEALATAVQLLAIERLDRGAGVDTTNDRDAYRHAFIPRAGRAALRALKESLAAGSTLYRGFVPSYIREVRLELGDDVKRPGFLWSAVALVPAEKTGDASSTFYAELQPINVVGADSWRRYSRLDVVFLITHADVVSAFASSFPDIASLTNTRGFAYRGSRAGQATVIIVSGVDGAAVSDVIKAIARLPSLPETGLLLQLDVEPRKDMHWQRRRNRRTGMTSLLERARGPLASGKGGSAIASERLAICSGGLSPVRGREAPRTPGLNLPPSGDADKKQCARNWAGAVRDANATRIGVV